MDEQTARLRTHQRNIDRYQNLLNTELSEVELRFLERHLSEERLAMATLEFLMQAQTQQNLRRSPNLVILHLLEHVLDEGAATAGGTSRPEPNNREVTLIWATPYDFAIPQESLLATEPSAPR
jgi:hypothetical protein